MTVDLNIPSGVEKSLKDLAEAQNEIKVRVFLGGSTFDKKSIEENSIHTISSFENLEQIMRELEENSFVMRSIVYVGKIGIGEERTDEWPVTAEFYGIADDSCIEFCNAHGLISDLRKLINKAKEAFSKRQKISAEYDRFPADEFEEEGHVVLKIDVSSDQDTAFREYDEFTDWIYDNVNDDNQDFFILSVNRL